MLYGEFAAFNQSSIVDDVQGKFVRIHFGTNGKIAGADIETCKYCCAFVSLSKFLAVVSDLVTI